MDTGSNQREGWALRARGWVEPQSLKWRGCTCRGVLCCPERLPGGTEGQKGPTVRGPWALQPHDEIAIIKNKAIKLGGVLPKKVLHSL